MVFGDWTITAHYQVLGFAVFLDEKLDLCLRFAYVLGTFPLLGPLGLCQLASPYSHNHHHHHNHPQLGWPSLRGQQTQLTTTDSPAVDLNNALSHPSVQLLSTTTTTTDMPYGKLNSPLQTALVDLNNALIHPATHLLTTTATKGQAVSMYTRLMSGCERTRQRHYSLRSDRCKLNSQL